MLNAGFLASESSARLSTVLVDPPAVFLESIAAYQTLHLRKIVLCFQDWYKSSASVDIFQLLQSLS